MPCLQRSRRFDPRQFGFWQQLRFWRLLLLPLLALLLTGCIDYDVGIRFHSPSSGEIVQQLRISERLRSLSDPALQQWTAAITQRTHLVGGQLEPQPDQTLRVRIPFSNATDLETKFNQFFSPDDGSLADAEFPAITSHLSLNRNNFILMERNQLQYDLDLRSLGVNRGNVVLAPAALINLEFAIDLPWGSQIIPGERPTQQPQTRHLSWKLVPGELNQIVIGFWLPNPIGIGTLAIALLVWLGRRLKHGHLPQTISASHPPSFE